MAKKILACFFAIIIICLITVSAFAVTVPKIEIVSQNSITGEITINIEAENNDTIEIYKKINEKTTYIGSYVSTSEKYTTTISFNELNCSENIAIEIYAKDSNGVTGESLKINSHGPHEIGNWTISKKAECDENGQKVKKCIRCDKIFDSKSIPATGHCWINPVWSWSDDCSSCSATFVCENNAAHTCTRDSSNISISSSVNSTCIENGSRTYIAKVGLDGVIYSDSKTITLPKSDHIISDWIVTLVPTCTESGTQVKRCINCKKITATEPISPLGHKYSIAYEWSGDNTTCTATAICERDNTHMVSETSKGVDKIIKSASCVESGRLVRTASFANNLFAPQSKTATITGSHVDANKDDICDVCRLRISSLPNFSDSTESGSLFDKLFNSSEEIKTNEQNETTTDAPIEIITSYEFDDDTTSPTITQPSQNNHGGKNNLNKVMVIVISIVSVGAIGAVVCVAALRKDGYCIKKYKKK